MDETVTCTQYTQNISLKIWAEILPLVADAAQYAHNEFSPMDVWKAIRRGDQQAWVVRKGHLTKFVWVTEILQQTNRKVVVVMAAAGEMEYGWEFWPWMSQWMIGNGIDEAEVCCRPSMARLLRKRGLKTLYEVLTIKPVGCDYEQQQNP